MNKKDRAEIFDQEGLFNTRSLLFDETDPSKIVAHGCYVYQPKLPIEPFFTISSEFGRLNNYCLAQFGAVQDEFFIHSEISKSEDGGFFEEEARSSSNDWKYHQNVTSRVVPILLLTSFLEWSLTKIYQNYTGMRPRQKKHMSKIESYLLSLEQDGLYEDDLSESSKDFLKELRVVRNAYAHGDIEDIGPRLGAIKLGSCFRLVSHILEVCERNCIHRDSA